MNNQAQGQSPRPGGYDDEISLVDLASILVKRWKAMAIIFTVIVLGALIYALIMPHTYHYTSIYSVAELGPDNALEAPKAVVTKAQNLYLEPETRKLLASIESKRAVLPFETRITNPAETQLVLLTSEASEKDADVVDEFHGNVLTRLKEGQQELVERRQGSLQRQLQSAQDALEVAKQSDSTSASEIVTSLMERIADLENDLAELQEGEVSQTAVKSLQPTGTSRKLILMLGVVLGGLLAVMGAFFMQFVGLVRSKLNK